VRRCCEPGLISFNGLMLDMKGDLTAKQGLLLFSISLTRISFDMFQVSLIRSLDSKLSRFTGRAQEHEV
jgi:hypothetical protein